MATSAASPGTTRASSSISPSSTCISTSNCGIPSAGTLYLFTFLATLLLVAIASAAIIARSVYLRRQLRRLALANPTPQRKPTEPDLKKKPQILDACLNLGGTVTENDLKHWECIVPFSATAAVNCIPPGKSEPPHPRQPHTAVAVAENSRDSRLRPVFARRLRHVLQPMNHMNNPVPVEAPTVIPLGVMETPASLKLNPRLQIAYIIAMPERSPTRPVQEQEECGEGEVPFVEFGVVEVDVVRSAGDGDVEWLLDGGKVLSDERYST